MIKHISEPELRAWVDSLLEGPPVYAPQARQGRFAFDRLRRSADLRLDYDVTILPPKKYFLPQQETLVRFTREGGFESAVEAEPFVLFGIHPYDLVAINQLDAIFARAPGDAHYLTRRHAATLVVLDVETVSEHHFAGGLGQATVDGNRDFDAMLTRLPDGSYVAEARTEKGRTLMDGLADAPDAGPESLAAREEVWIRNRKALRKHRLTMAPERIPELLADAHDHPIWEEKGALCYSCGACTLVCPTCYCFDVRDEWNPGLADGERVRTWDGCMFTQFAAVAGGHNFRKSRAARYRHRYFRKGKYVWDMIGEIACVGCGRCIGACTANIANPVEVYNRLQEDTP